MKRGFPWCKSGPVGDAAWIGLKVFDFGASTSCELDLPNQEGPSLDMEFCIRWQ